MIRSVPANAADSLYCMLLGQVLPRPKRWGAHGLDRVASSLQSDSLHAARPGGPCASVWYVVLWCELRVCVLTGGVDLRN